MREGEIGREGERVKGRGDRREGDSGSVKRKRAMEGV